MHVQLAPEGNNLFRLGIRFRQECVHLFRVRGVAVRWKTGQL
jgi:hypothetical protein